MAELQRQVESVTRRLRSQGLLARTIQIKVRDFRFRTITRRSSQRVPTASTEFVFKQARAMLQTWLEENSKTPVRLLGVGVSGLEKPDAHGIEYDTATQKTLDKTVDEINRRFGQDKATHALALKTSKKK
jgi:DNA polymerase-4